MATYISDASSTRWTIISPARSVRPDDFTEKDKKCPFCPGNESMTSTEVLRYGEGKAGQPGWTLRVVQNKFPIIDHHEVVIHSPSQTEDIVEFKVEQVEALFKAYKERYNFYREKGSVVIFCNKGEHAGASLQHPHSQIVILPHDVQLDTLLREPLNNIVEQTELFNVYCPQFSQWPYEIWIAPKKEGGYFGDSTEIEIKEVARLLQKTVRKLQKIYNEHPFSMLPFAYNYYVYPKENWFLRIIPRFVHLGGFESASGVRVNIVDPSSAALNLKEITVGSVLSELEKVQTNT